MCITYFRPKRRCYLDRNDNVYFLAGNASKRYVFAPCGVCEDCRKKQQYSWAWRLTADLQYYVQNKGYKVGFITLTYNEESIPRFPSCYEEIAGQYCFSREHTKNFILYVRKKLFEFYGITDSLYFLASEFGAKTQRPHYHVLWAWDGSKATPEQVHELIRHYWCDDFENNLTGKIDRKGFGFVCPATPQGGESKRDGKKILPFEVVNLNDCMMSAFYTAKYVTKDLYFMRTIQDKVTKEEYKSLKDFMPHHRQKKSLGFVSVAILSDDEKIDLLNKGRCFLGSDRLMMPPLYIQHKLLFKPCYVIDVNGDRLVKDALSDFMLRNLDLILSRKVSYYDTLFNRMKDDAYWISSGVDVRFTLDSLRSIWGTSLYWRLKDTLKYEDSHVFSLGSFVRDCSRNDLFGCKLSEAYLFYYGVCHCFCFKDKVLTYKNRYRHPALTYSSVELVEHRHYYFIQDFFNFFMRFTSFQVESVTDEDADFVRDFYNNLQHEE